MNPCLIPPSRLARLTVLRTQSDERLMFLVREGSEAAFEAIVQRYRRSLVTHCARLLGTADAEEAVQDGLVSAHAALARGDEVRSLAPWLHTVSHNAALAILRHRAARPECLDDELHDRPALDAPHAIRAELQAVLSAVQSLPPRQRDAIVMRELEGRSYSEIASRLGASDGAVRQLLNRARMAMRKSLGALIPAGPLARWPLAAGGGGSTVAAKLSGAAVLSAVSAIALLPPPDASVTRRVTSASSTRSHDVEFPSAPRKALARVPVVSSRATARIMSVPVRPVDQSHSGYPAAPVRVQKNRSPPRSASPSTGSTTGGGQRSSGGGLPSDGGWAGGSSSMPVSGGTPTMDGGGGATGSPDQQQQPMYEAPMQPAQTSWPTGWHSPTP